MSTPSNQVAAPAIFTGLDYSYYTFTGTWNQLPDFNTLTPVSTGTAKNVDIGIATQEDNFAFKWSGYIQIPKTGSYTFSTSSDDGSRLYINTPYSYSATPLVNNDGLHSNTLKSGTIQLNAGTYPITITYYEQGGDQVMQVYWQSTALNNNNTRTLIPDSVFKDQFTPSGNAPVPPSQIKAIPVSFKQINLTWTDNSANETGFEVYKSTSLGGPYNIVATTAANINTYSDSLCTPATTYYYKVQAINQYGSSGFNQADLGGLSYSYYQVASGLSKLPDFNSLTPVKTGTVPNITLDPRTGTTDFAFKFAGTLNITKGGQYTFYTKSDDNSDLYIGGYSASNLVVNNDYLQGATERSGTINLNVGSYPIYVTYMQQGGDYVLTTSYSGPGISKQLIPDSVFANPNMTATTLPAPERPAAPTGLSAVAESPYKIDLKWTSDLTNVDKFSIYRSVANASSYQFLKDVIANGSTSVTASDSSLFANTIYYYKVQAENALDSSSSFSNEINATTTDNLPVLENIGDQTVRYNTSLLLNIVASDPDGEKLNLSVENLPGFGTFQDYGDGTGLITINPSQQNEGTYPNIKVNVSDQHGGTSSQSFKLTVNDNYSPVIGAIGTVTMNAGSVYNDTLIATDQNIGDVLTWDVQGLPSFAQFDRVSSDTAIVIFSPGYENAGNYNLYVNVSDGKGGNDSKILSLNVNYVDPVERWYLNFSYQTSANSPWNNITGLNSSNLTDDRGNITPVGLNFQTTWWATYDGGSVTGNNSGLYPDNVIKDYYYFGIFGGPDSVSAVVTGLTPGQEYDLTFFASSSWNGVSDNGHTVFTSEGKLDSLYVQKNSQNALTFHSLLADSSGKIAFAMKKGIDASAGYLNALVINSVYTSNQAPVTPANFNVQNNQNNGVKVSWRVPVLNTASGYEIYRSTSETSGFALLNGSSSVPSSDSLYLDTTAAGNTTYYYTMRAINQNGTSEFTDTLQVTTLVKNPSINAVEDIQMKYGDTKSVTISAQADPLDTISLSASNLPTFVSFQDLGGGNGIIKLMPKSTDIGKYAGISISATTNHGGKDTVMFAVTVSDRNIRRVNINLLHSGSVSTGIWNNVGGWAFAGTTLANLMDDNGTPTNFKITLLDQWSNSIDNGGHITYNNSGVVPDSIIASYFYQSDNSVRRIQLTGLSVSAKYNFSFVSSSVIGDGTNPDYTTNFNINNTTVTINGYRNTDKFAQINGVSADQNGQIIINVSKSSSSLDAILNAIIVDEVEDTSIILQPTDLAATASSRTKVNLKWLDHASNESGYKVYRADSAEGTYVLLATLSKNSNQYLDQTVVSNKKYFYKVQAFGSGPLVSDFSNIAAVTTPQYAIYMNFNSREAAAPAPWNNSNKPPIDGDVFSNLTDENGNPTGVTLTFIKNFENENNVGVITGNNSGIFPDLVMNGEYYLDNGLDTVVLNVSGLNIANKYTFSFFGSLVNFGWNNTTLFLINGKMVGLNVANNSNQTVSLNGISPDSLGSITIKMINANHCAYAILGALVIYSYTNYDDNGNPVIDNPMIMRMASKQQLQMMQYSKITDTDGNPLILSAYPNPFHGLINVTLKHLGAQDGETVLSLFDVSGRRIYQNNLGLLSEGTHSVTLDLSSYNLISQIYILKMTTSKSHKTVTLKMIRF
ncbi:MAG TPA: PA14 domain-containing protein [Candidatus Babeliaceae bacterium]|nr:PA14 domain-containing protein [Candidatus Babeliaceae bacterium]